MSDDVGPGRPPVASRFLKGKSGNPKGRPRSKPARSVSAFDIVIDKSLTLTDNGRPREVSVEEALQHKIFQDAFAGSRTAQREVLRMIAKREAWFAAKEPKIPRAALLVEPVDPRNANEALVLLEIAEPDPQGKDLKDPYRHLLLQPWAVQAALRRRRRCPLSDEDIAEIKRCTRDAGKLSGLGGTRDE